MGKKSKIAAEDERMELQDAPPAKKKSKKHSSAEIDVPVATNGTELDRSKKKEKKKNKGLTGETVGTVGESPAEEKISKKKRKNDDPVEESAQNRAEDENGNGETKKSKKQKKNQPLTDAAEEDEQLISFKKPSKKRSVEPENLEQEDEVPPAKVSNADGNAITAGTTIDQIPGIKLKNKKGKRAKRREKQAKQVEEKRQKSKKKDRDAMQEYLQCWSTDRDKWKFHKQTQIHIQQHVFDEVEINADLWPIALEYLGGSKGSSKELLVKRAKSIINDGDAKAAAADGDETLQASSKYERARELLQFLG